MSVLILEALLDLSQLKGVFRLREHEAISEGDGQRRVRLPHKGRGRPFHPGNGGKGEAAVQGDTERQVALLRRLRRREVPVPSQVLAETGWEVPHCPQHRAQLHRLPNNRDADVDQRRRQGVSHKLHLAKEVLSQTLPGEKHKPDASIEFFEWPIHFSPRAPLESPVPPLFDCDPARINDFVLFCFLFEKVKSVLKIWGRVCEFRKNP